MFYNARVWRVLMRYHTTLNFKPKTEDQFCFSLTNCVIQIMSQILVDEVNFKIKEMTINEIKELVENTKGLTKDEMYNVSTHLKFFDRVNYVAWVNKLLGIKLAL
jgi:hypothetical protein